MELADADGTTGASAVGEGITIVLIQATNISGDSLARAYTRAMLERHEGVAIQPVKVTLHGRAVMFIDLGEQVRCDEPCPSEVYVLADIDRLLIASVPNRDVAGSIVKGFLARPGPARRR